MSYTVTELLRIATGEIGYKEKETNSQLDNPGANAGDANYTKYARDLAAAGYYQASKQGFAWCDMFVDWCFLQMCGNRAKAEEITCQTGLYGAGCEWSARYYREQGRFFSSNPQPGDQIFFNNYAHTGIVEKIVGNVITTIEGNTSNQVARRTYSINSSSIDGYGRPKYDVENSVESVEKPGEAAEHCQLSLPTLKVGSEGAPVKAVQLILNSIDGCECGDADGIFGQKTYAALRIFQKKNDLEIDGICGINTWKKLLGA